MDLDDDSFVFDEVELCEIDDLISKSQSTPPKPPEAPLMPGVKRLSESPKPDAKRPLLEHNSQLSCRSTQGGTQNVSFAFGADLQQILIENARKPSERTPTLVRKKSVGLEGLVPSLSTQDCSSGFESFGDFYGLPDRIRELIHEHKGVETLYDWQKECLELKAVQDRQNLIYSISTSGGKTLVAEILLFRELLCRKKNVILVLPYVSIVQEKVRSLSPFALEMNFLVEEYAAGRGMFPPKQRLWKNVVFVATIEKALGLFNCLAEERRLHEVGLVVVDEIHMIGEQGRGATLESLISKFMFASKETQIVGMSATIGNMHELASFMQAEVYSKEFRPVVLKEYIKLEDRVLLIDQKADAIFCPKRVVESDDKKMDPDALKKLVAEVIPDKSCLVFCPTKKNCENVALLLSRGMDKSMTKIKSQARLELYRALKEEGSGVVCDILKKTIPFGVAYHHSGLTLNERNLLEEGFRAGALCCLCCTSTLAAGVNLPAQRVILRSPKIGIEFLHLSQYKQMVGRAGRAGMDDVGESILICQMKELEKVREILQSGMTWCHSQLNAHPDILEGLVLSLVGLDLATSATQLTDFVEKFTLFGHQSQCEVQQLIESVISSLYKSQVLSLKEDSLLLEDHSELKVSPLGRAAMKANLTMDHAKNLLEDLSKAQGALNLLTPLHLLYLIIAPDRAQKTRFSAATFASVFKRMSSNDKKTAELVGISEGVIATLMRGCKPKSVPEEVLNRFYLALLLSAMWDGKLIWDVSDVFDIPRGDIQSLMVSSASQASNIKSFCQEYAGSLWCFHSLLSKICDRLSHCCSAEILELMELPAVKKGRAQQLFKAGYKTLVEVASANPKEMVGKIEHLPRKVANQLVSSAKMLLMEKAESLREEAEIVLGSMKEQLLESFTQSPNRSLNQSTLS